jgi:purine nucleosidase
MTTRLRNPRSNSMAADHRIILDTDIGSDLDDALALACILGSPGVTLDGITTVYGDTTIRAGIAARLCELAGHTHMPIVPGCRTPKSGREVWWAGFEGSNFDSLESELIERDLDAPEFLVRHVAAHPGQVDILAIGPLTNIAAAIEADPAFATNLRHLYVMGGDFGSARAEHNFKSDADAAKVVFDSPVRCTVTGLEITTTVRLEQHDFDDIAHAGPLGAALSREIASFLTHTQRDWSHPHDPISLLPLLDETDFEYAVGRIEIAVDGAEPGASSITVARDANARIVSRLSADDARTRVQQLVLAGCRRGA